MLDWESTSFLCYAGDNELQQRTSSSSGTRVKSGCSVKCFTIQVCTSSTSVMVYTKP